MFTCFFSKIPLEPASFFSVTSYCICCLYTTDLSKVLISHCQLKVSSTWLTWCNDCQRAWCLYQSLKISYGCLKPYAGLRTHSPKTEHFHIHSNNAELLCSCPATDWIASQPKIAANIFALQSSGITIGSNHIACIPGRRSLKAEKCTLLLPAVYPWAKAAFERWCLFN